MAQRASTLSGASTLLVFIVYQTKLSKSTELLDLSELSASQQNQLWTQVDNWAVAVVFANFCERPTSLEERMLKYCTPL